MFVVGLTGGIGSGKSTVATHFSRLAVPVIDTDIIARDLTASDGAVRAALRARFGEAVFQPGGELDRDALRRVVFADAGARRDLEAILHPRIRQAVVGAIARLQGPYAVVVVPLLVETGSYADLVDRVLVVDCPETLQIERVMSRNGMPRADVEAIVAAQASRAARLAAADDVLENSGRAADLAEHVAQLDQRYRVLAGASSP